MGSYHASLFEIKNNKEETKEILYSLLLGLADKHYKLDEFKTFKIKVGIEKEEYL